MKFEKSNFLELSGLLQACNGTALPFPLLLVSLLVHMQELEQLHGFVLGFSDEEF